MAAGQQLLDINTLQPINNGSAYPRPTSNVGISTTGGGTTSNETTTANTNQTQTTVQNQINMTPGSLAALESLIKQLSDRPAISEAELNSRFPLATRTYNQTVGWHYVDPVTGRSLSNQEAEQFNNQQTVQREQAIQQAGTISGGTDQQKKTQAERDKEIKRNRQQQGEYSKDAAFADAQNLVDKAIADALEVAMPQIIANSEAAGTSKSSFRGLAVADAAQKGAVEGAALGSQLSVAYGQIYNQLANTLEALTRQDPNGPAAMLLQALNVAKGAVTSGVSTTDSSGTTTSNTQKIGTAVQVGTDNKQIEYANPGANMTPLTALPAQPQLQAGTSTPGVKPSAPTRGYAFALGTDNAPASSGGTFDSNAAYEAIADDAINYEE